MGRLHDLFHDQGQSPWLDNLKRGWLADGQIARWVERGVRGITSNPAIFQKAIESGAEYDEQFGQLIAAGVSVEEAYWTMVCDDITAALALLEPIHASSGGLDGYVSVEVAPSLARNRVGTEAAARQLDDRIHADNLYVKIPATREGVPAIAEMISEGRSINVTLIFSLERYDEVIEAYISGLERATGNLEPVSSVASFFISRVDTEIDRRLDTIGTDEALALRGTAAITQGQLAYSLWAQRFSGARWDALAARGARPQRALWASTSTKNPTYPDTLYVDALIGPHTVNTIPDTTLEAFDDHGTVARTLDADFDSAELRWRRLGELVDLADVAAVLEAEGVATFEKSYDELLGALETKAAELRG